MAVVVNPVLTSVGQYGGVRFPKLNFLEPEPQVGNFAEDPMSKVFEACGHIESLESKRFPRSLGVIEKRLVERIVDVDQHRVIILRFQQGFYLRVEVTKKSGDRPGSLDLEKTGNAIPMSVQIATLVLQFLVSVCCVELVNFLDDHHGSLFEPVATYS